MDILEKYCLIQIEKRIQNDLLRNDKIYQRIQNNIILRDSNLYCSFSCNDYFGLSNNLHTIKKTIEYIKKWGFGAGASRLITGNNKLYQKLENKISEYRDFNHSLIFSSGYSAAVGTIPAIVGRQDIVISDKFIHASLIDGIILSKAKHFRFHHNCIKSCEKILSTHRKKFIKSLLIVENVYSMHGDIAPLLEIKNLCKKYNTILLIDDAHGLGVINITVKPDILIGTLSKALGSIGGYICTSQIVRDYLFNYARTLIYSTALPPIALAIAHNNLSIIEKSEQSPLDQAKLFCNIMNMPEPESQIIILPVKDNKHGLILQKYLENNGILVSLIRPPTVLKPIIRLSFSTKHTQQQIYKLCKLLSEFK